VKANELSLADGITSIRHTFSFQVAILNPNLITGLTFFFRYLSTSFTSIIIPTQPTHYSPYNTIDMATKDTKAAKTWDDALEKKFLLEIIHELGTTVPKSVYEKIAARWGDPHTTGSLT
jgi:hypothetical protein